MKLSRGPLSGSLLAVMLVLAGCTPTSQFVEQQVPFERQISGIDAPVNIRRDKLGIPLVEAKNDEDLHFALGYVAAADRLSQMVGTKLVSQGRLAEWMGEPVLDIDRYMRAMDLRRAALVYWNAATPEQKKLLQRYADGVNAYIASGNLPDSFRLTDYRPEQWEPADSLTIVALNTLMLSTNAPEEIAYLKLAQSLGPEKAAWLVPVYPDQPLPLEEARKLGQVDLNAVHETVERLLHAQNQHDVLGLSGIAASNNWAVHKSRTKGGASIIANDPHLPLSLPSVWHFVHARTPAVDWAGVSIAGVPGPLMGYNGHVAWGATMVMGDNQDIFLEKLWEFHGKLHYLHKGKWVPCDTRREAFRVKDGRTEYQTYYSTRNGALLNPLLRQPGKLVSAPTQLRTTYGLAFRHALHDPASSPLALSDMVRAKSVAEAQEILKRTRGAPLNVVFGDRDNIAWQVTGTYPIRKKGNGHFPSPAWDGDYDWDGYLDPAKHPSSQNPDPGYIGTANERIVARDFPHTLSSSWFYPERSERIKQMLSKNEPHSSEDSMKMQLDRHSPVVGKLQEWLKQDENRTPLEEAMAALGKSKGAKAREALSALLALDGTLEHDSREAAIYGVFLHSFIRRTFLDELGPESEENWKAFVRLANSSYSAPMDHLIVRGDDSPFWDDVRTPAKETKAGIIAQSLVDTINYLEGRIGLDRKSWNWGKLHTYHWKTEAAKMAPMLSLRQRLGIESMDKVLNRGPFPAGGDHTTLNLSSYNLGLNFDTWLVPTMRMIVDFSREEPMLAINSSGQSGNPGSRNYDDSIAMFLEGRYHTLPFKQQNIDQAYGPALTLVPGK